MTVHHKWGGYVPNEGPARIHDIVEVVGDGCYTIMAHKCGDGNLKLLRSLCPNALIMVRVYTDNWYGTHENPKSPELWAEECWDILNEGADPIVAYTQHFTWANEQNLRHESKGAIGAADGIPITWRDYEIINDFNVRFIGRWRKLDTSNIWIRHYPGLAVGHSDDQDDGIGIAGYEILRHGIEQCHVLNTHQYKKPGHPPLDEWNGVGRIEKTHELFPNMLLFVAETGTFEVTHQDAPQWHLDIGYHLQALWFVCGVTPFIFDTTSHEHDSNNWSRNPAIAEAWKNATRVMYTDPVWTVPGGNTMVMHGNDISNHQAGLQLATIVPPPEFVIAKVTQDSTFVDRFYAGFRSQARAMGIGFGGYHFVDIDVQPNPEESCDFFLEHAQLDTGDIGVLDLEEFEYSPGVKHNMQPDQLDHVLRWGRRFVSRTGFQPYLYVNQYHIGAHNLNHPEVADIFRLWYAYWSDRTTFPPVPSPFTSYKLWQYNADVLDKNRFDGTLADFRATGKPAPAGMTAEQLRDEAYALAGKIQTQGPRWRALGYPQHAAMVENVMEGFRNGLVIGKGEK